MALTIGPPEVVASFMERIADDMYHGKRDFLSYFVDAALAFGIGHRELFSHLAERCGTSEWPVSTIFEGLISEAAYSFLASGEIAGDPADGLRVAAEAERLH